jgi:hypothetical protein
MHITRTETFFLGLFMGLILAGVLWTLLWHIAFALAFGIAKLMVGVVLLLIGFIAIKVMMRHKKMTAYRQ